MYRESHLAGYVIDLTARTAAVASLFARMMMGAGTSARDILNIFIIFILECYGLLTSIETYFGDHVWGEIGEKTNTASLLECQQRYSYRRSLFSVFALCLAYF